MQIGISGKVSGKEAGKPTLLISFKSDEVMSGVRRRASKVRCVLCLHDSGPLEICACGLGLGPLPPDLSREQCALVECFVHNETITQAKRGCWADLRKTTMPCSGQLSLLFM